MTVFQILALQQFCASEEAKPVRISVIHSNDLHGHLYAGRDDLGLGLPRRRLGGGLATARAIETVRNARAADGGGLLLVDGGDVYHGTPEGDFTGGQAVVDYMNLLGYDAVVIGNHEFAFGVENFLQLTRTAKFGWLGGNITSRRKDWKNPISSVVTREFGSVKVAVIGITTPRCRELNLPRDTQGLTFTNCSEYVVPAVQHLCDQGYVVIVLSHCGSQTEEQIASLIPQAAALIGAHDHTLRSYPRRPDRPYLGQVGEYGRRLGIIDMLVVPNGKKPVLKAVTGKILNLEPVKTAKTDFERKILDFTKAQRFGSFDVVVAESPQEFPRYPKGNGPSALGALVAESMRAATKSDCALVGFGGIRGGLPKGNLTLRDFYLVYPFDDKLRVLELDGKQLIKAFRNQLRGGRLQIGASGLTFKYDSTARTSKRVFDVVAGTKEVTATGRYRLVVTEFLLQRLLVERRIKPFEVVEYDMSVFEALTRYCGVQPDTSALAGGLLSASLAERGDRKLGKVPVVPLGGVAVQAPPKFWQSLRIDLNAANYNKLRAIPWISDKLAQEILNYREKYGAFRSMSELSKLPGMTNEQYKKLERSVVIR